VSEKLQKGAQERALSARDRADHAEERARRSETSGDDLGARIHRESAKLHARSADAADLLRELDAAMEGTRVRQPSPQEAD
jgi:hypothetical protein